MRPIKANAETGSNPPIPPIQFRAKSQVPKRSGLRQNSCVNSKAFTAAFWKSTFLSSNPARQPVLSPSFRRPTSRKSPPNGRYLGDANCLRVTKLEMRSAKSQRVSTDSLRRCRATSVFASPARSWNGL
jgi:hypothetical protein